MDAGIPYSSTLSATGQAPLAWSVFAGTVPTGLTLDPSTGVVSGTPATGGRYAFTVRVTDAAGRTVDGALSLALTERRVLLFGPSVANGTLSLEAQAITDLGLTVEIADAGTWAGKSAADFARYRAIVIGDPAVEDAACGDAAYLGPAITSAMAWGGAVDGNVFVLGAGPATHFINEPALQHAGSGPQRLNDAAIAHVAGVPGSTGAYVSLGCAYRRVATDTTLHLLDGLGAFGVSTHGGSQVNEFAIPTTCCQTGSTEIITDPHDLIAGGDGKIWLVEGDSDNITAVTSAGVVTAHHVPSCPSTTCEPNFLVWGGDGRVWFSEGDTHAIGAMTTTATPAPTTTHYPLLTCSAAPSCEPGRLTLGGDGAVWFVMDGSSVITRIAQDGSITQGNVRGGDGAGITTAADGTVWYSLDSGRLGRIPTAAASPVPGASGIPAPSTPPSVAATAGSGLTTGAYRYVTTYYTATGATTVALAAPSATPSPLPTAGTSLLADIYKYVLTFVQGSAESGTGPEVSVATTAGNQAVTLGSLPIGPSGTTARRIYRTAAGGASGTERLVATVSDNTTPTYTDVVPDASLGAQAPGLVAITGTQAVTVTLPAVPTGVVGRAVWRTAVNGASGTERFVGEVLINTVTTLTDTITDAGLGFQVPSLDTTTWFAWNFSGANFGALAFDGNGTLWVAGEGKVYGVGTSDPAGTLRQFGLGRAETELWGLTKGPDGNIWFTGGNDDVLGFSDVLVRVTPAGDTTELRLGALGVNVPSCLARRLGTMGTGPLFVCEPQGIAKGTDGKLYVVFSDSPKVIQLAYDPFICNDGHKVSPDAAFSAIGDGDLHGWNCSFENIFSRFPGSFSAFAIDNHFGGSPYALIRTRVQPAVAFGGAELQIGPGQGPANLVIDVVGRGFASGAGLPCVEFSWDGAAPACAAALSDDAAGNVSGTVIVPASSGSHYLMVRTGPTRSSTATYVVTGSTGFMTFDWSNMPMIANVPETITLAAHSAVEMLRDGTNGISVYNAPCFWASKTMAIGPSTCNDFSFGVSTTALTFSSGGDTTVTVATWLAGTSQSFHVLNNLGTFTLGPVVCAGGNATVGATGFAPNTAIHAYVDAFGGIDIVTGANLSDGTGSFSGTITVPALATGSHRFELSDGIGGKTASATCP